jgi:bifunctional UDP-N-acetylglucosamine pyrophosphorylase/glucosamine-1-phosphate N-acetyltransferase
MTRTRKVAAIVLAAGRSQRFRGSHAKVLHPLLGRPILMHVLETLREVHRTRRLSQVVVVVPPGGDVERVVSAQRFPFPVTFAVQKDARGTGAAAQVGLRKLTAVGDDSDVLVLAGDMPLVRATSLLALVDARRESGAAGALLSAVAEEPPPYGRIVRNGDRVVEIVEAKDATEEQLRIREVNLATYAFDRGALGTALPRLRADNAQAERYLTDAVAELVKDGLPVTSVEGDVEEVLGTNTRGDFAAIARLLRERVVRELMDGGVTVIDPATTYVDAGVDVGADTVLRPNTFLEGRTSVGSGCDIGPNVRLVDTSVGDGATVTFAVALGTKIGPDAEVGPFASLRPGTNLRRGAKAGTFVEMKAADVGEETKVPHLAYMGDVRIGKGSNIGAGSITGNYNPFELAPDGSTKHRTTIGDDVYVGSDTTFVAPVRVGDGSQTGAGSVVTRNVKAGELVFGVPARSRGPAKKRAAKGTKKRGNRKGKTS